MRDKWCYKCGGLLGGKKFHAFVTRDGKARWCGECTYPKPKKRIITYEYE